jgi:hypothetical protein
LIIYPSGETLYSALRNMRRCHELSKVLRILQNDGIPVIVLKGAALAEVVYGNIALRSMSDVDLLVKKGSIKSRGKTAGDGLYPA